MNSVQSAQEMGIVAGGGTTLAYLQHSYADKLMAEITDEDEAQGAKIVLKSLSAPVKQIAKNAGIEGEVILAKIKAKFDENRNYGWNARTNEYGDLLEMGVVDPAKVTINALENSASIAGLVLTTECLVTEIPVKKSDADIQAEFDSAGMNTGIPGGMQGY